MKKPTTNEQPPVESVYQPPRMVKGRRQYTCCECGELIFEGDEHELFSGKFVVEGAEKADADTDGRVWKTWRTCCRCLRVRRRVAELTRAAAPERGFLAPACKPLLREHGIDAVGIAREVIGKLASTFGAPRTGH